MVAEERPRQVRLTRVDGDTLTIERPTIAGDSIVGLSGIFFRRVAISDVQLLEVERISPTKTAAMFVAQAGAVVSIIALIIDLLPHYRGF